MFTKKRKKNPIDFWRLEAPPPDPESDLLNGQKAISSPPPPQKLIVEIQIASCCNEFYLQGIYFGFVRHHTIFVDASQVAFKGPFVKLAHPGSNLKLRHCLRRVRQHCLDYNYTIPNY